MSSESAFAAQDICNLVECQTRIGLNLYSSLLIFLLFLSGCAAYLIRRRKAAIAFLVFAAVYGLFIHFVGFSSQFFMEYSWTEPLFSLRLVSFSSHTATTLASFFMILLVSERRFLHDSFLYLASGAGIIVIALASIFAQHWLTNSLGWERIPGGGWGVGLVSASSGAILILVTLLKFGVKSVLSRKSGGALTLLFLGTSISIFLSFRLQGNELEILRKSQSLFLTAHENAIQETIDGEVQNLDLLLRVRKGSLGGSQNAASLIDLAKEMISSSSVVRSMVWVNWDGRVIWNIGKTDDDGSAFGEAKLLRPIEFYTALPGSAHVLVITPTNLAERDSIEIVLPYIRMGEVRGQVIEGLNLTKLLKSSLELVPLTRFNYGIISEDDRTLVSNIQKVYWPEFVYFGKFDIFGQSFKGVIVPTIGVLKDLVTPLPKFLLIFGFLSSLALAHLLFLYSNLLVSYDEVERIVELRTRELGEATRRALDANATKTLFLANVSHEIRSPLNILNGVSELLQETNLDSVQKKYVGMFRQACSNLLSLVNDLIDVSKIESGKIEFESHEFNLKNFVNDLVNLYQVRSAERGIQIINQTSGLTHETFRGDTLRIKQVLGNILGNAIKFTDQGVVTLTVANAGNVVTFKISDTGIGIPSDKLGTVFDRFVQIDNSSTRNKGGAGLGLAIAKELAEKMGGTISVSSELGHGSVFTVTLVLEKIEQLSKNGDASKMDASLRPGLKILLTDDSADNRELIKVFLKKYDAAIDEAENGKVAVEKFKENSYDLLLMDMQMPVMDGYTATQKIREFEAESGGGRTPIVALTAHALKEDSRKCLSAGCDRYLAKPVSKSTLLEQINAVTLS